MRTNKKNKKNRKKKIREIEREWSDKVRKIGKK